MKRAASTLLKRFVMNTKLLSLIVVAIVSIFATACSSAEPSTQKGNEEIDERTSQPNEQTDNEGKKADGEDVDETGRGRRGTCWAKTGDVRCWDYNY
jgi:hypothetical protein